MMRMVMMMLSMMMKVLCIATERSWTLKCLTKITSHWASFMHKKRKCEIASDSWNLESINSCNEKHGYIWPIKSSVKLLDPTNECEFCKKPCIAGTDDSFIWYTMGAIIQSLRGSPPTELESMKTYHKYDFQKFLCHKMWILMTAKIRNS